MRTRDPHELGKAAAAWLATCLVLAAGATTCTVLALLFLEHPVRPLIYGAASVAGMGFFLWLLRDRPRKETSLSLVAWVLRGRDSTHPVTSVRVGKKKSDVPVQHGTHAPPSVEQVRDIAANQNHWVPGKSKGASPPNQQHRAELIR